MAGLNTLAPKPPKAILPNVIAKTAPKTTMVSGIVGGRIKPNSIPVTKTASETFPPLPRTNIHSVTTQVITDSETTAKLTQPKK